MNPVLDLALTVLIGVLLLAVRRAEAARLRAG